jgi:hypothetical protein
LKNSRRWNVEAFAYARTIKTLFGVFLNWKSRMNSINLSKELLKRSIAKIKKQFLLNWRLRAMHYSMARIFQRRVWQNLLIQRFGSKYHRLSQSSSPAELFLKVCFFQRWLSRTARARNLLRVVSNINLLKIKQKCFKYWACCILRMDCINLETASRFARHRFFQKWLQKMKFYIRRSDYAIQYHHESLAYSTFLRWKQALYFEKADNQRSIFLVRSWKKWRSASRRAKFDEGRKMVKSFLIL